MLAWLLVTGASAQTADFDTLAEGTNATLLTDGGLTFGNLDDRGASTPPGSLAIEDASADLAGLTGFTTPNCLGFGGYSPGTGSAFGRFGSVEITNGGVGGSAEVHVFELGGNAGLTLRLEALLGGVTVGTDSDPMAAAGGIREHVLTVSGVTFDTLRVSIGPNATDVSFLLVDHVVVGPPLADSGATGDTGPLPTGDSGDSGDSADTGATESPEGDTDADSDPVPDDTDTGAAADKGGCGCEQSRGGGLGLLVLAIAARRRSRQLRSFFPSC